MKNPKHWLQGLRKDRIRSDFFRNVLITFSGTATASLVSLLLTPVVTRIFDPDDFGQVAFLIALTTNLGLLATLAFPQALVMPRSRTTFYQLVRLCLALLTLATVIILLAILFKGESLLQLFNMTPLGKLIYLLPLFVFLNELNRIAVNWNVRRKRFRANAYAGVTNNLSIRVAQIIYAFLVGPGLFGLLTGNITAYILRLWVLLHGQWKELYRLLFRIRFAELKKVALVFQSYPRWIFPSALIESVSASLPIYVLAIYYDATTVGHFSFAQALLNHPYVMLSASVMPVFFQRANELYQKGLPELQDFALRIFRRLTTLGAIVFGAAIFFSDWILPFIFGEKWVTSGVFAGSLAIYLAFRFISVPLLPIFRVLHKEQYDFLGSGSIFIFRVVSLFIGVRFFAPETTILLFSVAGAMACLINMLLIFSLLKMPVAKILLRTFLIFTGVFLFYWSLRQFLEWII
ncbi:MAG: oligosaccharide flippase family protein [Saprospiraceae bacterium]|nr:oligosaccharide flippase family protein [Saprospiraceae bacterium]